MIIKNCPAIKEITTLLMSEPPQVQNEWRCCATGSNLKKCENINNCVMKRIVGKCKENLNSLETYVDVRSFECAALQNILQLLDIEECE